MTLLLLCIAACGFTPVYRKDGVVSERLAAVEIAPMAGRLGQQMTGALERTLAAGSGQPKRYRLEIVLVPSRRIVSIEQDRRINRYDVVMDSQYVLRNLETGAALDRGTMQAITSYTIVESDFASYIAERDAQEQAIRKLAEKYRLSLLGTLQPLESASHRAP